jgi:hypothetical protein
MKIPGIAMVSVPVAVLLLLAAGCNQNAVRGKTASSAPGLNGESQAHIRGVSDPNAPFTLINRSNATGATGATAASGAGAAASGANPGEVTACRAADLQVYEAAASTNGDARVVRLALKNNGATPCRLSGYPVIELQDELGAAIASIAVRQTGAASLSGTVAAPVREAAAQSGAASAAVDVVLRPAGEASFEIGWSTGDGCPLVSHFTVGLPVARDAGSGGNPSLAGTFSINRALNVCNGEMQVTALRAAAAI